MAGRFVGRDGELRTLGARLETARLVTLLGIGGIGKSRLAREYARAHPTKRVVFCDVSGARTEEEICTAVAAALGIGLAVAGPLAGRIEALGKAMASRADVFVLDAAETAAARLPLLVAPWLAAARSIRIVVTSRVRLGASDEHVIAVEPLGDEAETGPSPAERLFVERARAAGATIDMADLPNVRTLVRALEGIPLAIELVAARARLLPVATLLARVQGGREIAGEGGHAQRRHATMRDVIAGSWELLDRDAQEALLACACFRGGFSLESAEAMLAPDGLAVLERLVDASLVRTTPTADATARFDLFQTVRAYAAERMDERPALRRVLFRRHAAHVAHAATGWRVPTLSREHDNLAVALTRLLAEGPLDTEAAGVALTLAAELEPIRMVRGHAATYVAWLREALRAPCEPTAPALRAPMLRATLCEARALAELGVVDESRAAFERALTLAGHAADLVAEGHARCGLSRLDAHAGEWQRALAGFAEAKVCAVRARDEGLLHLALANDAFHGSELHDSEEQLVPLERAAAYFRAAGDERESLFWTVQLGRAYTDFDRDDRAYARLTDGLRRARAIGDRRTEGFASFALGGVHLSRGDLDEAVASYRTATEIFAEVGKERDRGYAFGYLGVALHLRERFEEAEAALAAGCEALSAVGDEPNVVLFSLFRAGLAADRDETNDAAAQLARAQARAEHWSGSGMRAVVVEVLGALLAASRARDAFRRADLEGFATHRSDAARRLERAKTRPARVESGREIYDWRSVSLDVRVAFRLAKRAVDALALLALPPRCVLVVGECTRIRTHTRGEWVDLGGRRVLRRVLGKLVGERLAARGSAVSASSLVEAGWPGETMAPASAKNRLHVTLGMLRRLGLGEVLEHVPGGWRLRAEVPIVRVAADDASIPST